MTTIAFLTFFFLPGTAIASFFSTVFFDRDSTTGRITVSSDFYKFWAVVIPATIATILAGAIWWRYLRSREHVRKVGPEKSKGEPNRAL